MREHYYAVIMAGGGGTRLWPLSRQARPKQMLRLIDDRSLFQTSVERLKKARRKNYRSSAPASRWKISCWSLPRAAPPR